MVRTRRIKCNKRVTRQNMKGKVVVNKYVQKTDSSIEGMEQYKELMNLLK